MIEKIRNIFKNSGKKKGVEYAGVTDFFLHATPDEKIKVFTEAAHRANEDQRKTFNEAQLKLKAN